MTSEKIDPRLQEEMSRIEKSRETARTIQVLIELEAAANAGTSGLQGLEEKVRAAQQGVRKKLEELGAGKTVRALTLANALEAALTPLQIATVAALPEVKRLTWNRAEKVTA
jgi:hypothetical protein